MAVGNNVVFIGRFVRDLEIKTAGEHKVVSFALARDRAPAQDGKEKVTDFVDCVAWNKTAELIANYHKKGDRIGVSGHLQTRSYDDANGVKRKVTEIVVESIEFLKDRPRDENSASATPKASAPASNEETNHYTSDDELPF